MKKLQRGFTAMSALLAVVVHLLLFVGVVGLVGAAVIAIFGIKTAVPAGTIALVSGGALLVMIPLVFIWVKMVRKAQSEFLRDPFKMFRDS